MLYYAPFNNTANEDPRFSSRGAALHMQGPVSRLVTDVIPDYRQIAYAIYKDNIDVFLAATALKKVLPINSPVVDTPFIGHTFPLTYPKTAISFKLKKETLDAVMKLLRDNSSEVTKVENMPKFPDAYVLTTPAIKTLLQVVPAAGTSPIIGGCCGVKSTIALSQVFSAIELYMRLCTYPAYSSDEGTMDVPSMSLKRAGTFTDFYKQIGKHPKVRYSSLNYVHSDEPMKGVTEEGMWIGESDAKQVLDFENGVNQVASAKPGGIVNSSWGLPSACPAKPGICFEYFEGMNSPDKPFMQMMMCRLFFRCFGKDPKAKYINFREDIQGAANTAVGLALTHMLKGIEISLDAQGQFFALFDGPAYLGFVVLGAKWKIRWGAKWIVPEAAVVLQEELLKIKTHSTSLQEVVVELNAAGLMVDVGDVDSPVKLAEHLALITWEGTEEEVKGNQKRLERIVGRLEFGTRKVGFAIDTFMKAISDLDPSANIASQHVTFPSPREYPLLKDRAAIVLSRFGYKVPSFDIWKGKDAVFANNADFALGPGVEKGKATLDKVKTVMISEKPFATAIKDFRAFMLNPKVYQSSGERSGSYQHHTFKAERKDRILQALAVLTKDVVAAEKDAKAKEKKETPFSEDAFLKSILGAGPARSVSRAASVTRSD